MHLSAREENEKKNEKVRLMTGSPYAWLATNLISCGVDGMHGIL